MKPVAAFKRYRKRHQASRTGLLRKVCGLTQAAKFPTPVEISCRSKPNLKNLWEARLASRLSVPFLFGNHRLNFAQSQHLVTFRNANYPVEGGVSGPVPLSCHRWQDDNAVEPVTTARALVLHLTASRSPI